MIGLLNALKLMDIAFSNTMRGGTDDEN